MGYIHSHRTVVVLFNPNFGGGGDNGVHTFLKAILPKVNVIAKLEFESFYNDVTVQQISLCATETSSRNSATSFLIS